MSDMQRPFRDYSCHLKMNVLCALMCISTRWKQRLLKWNKLWTDKRYSNIDIGKWMIEITIKLLKYWFWKIRYFLEKKITKLLFSSNNLLRWQNICCDVLLSTHTSAHLICNFLVRIPWSQLIRECIVEVTT